METVLPAFGPPNPLTRLGRAWVDHARQTPFQGWGMLGFIGLSCAYCWHHGLVVGWAIFLFGLVFVGFWSVFAWNDFRDTLTREQREVMLARLAQHPQEWPVVAKWLRDGPIGHKHWVAVTRLSICGTGKAPRTDPTLSVRAYLAIRPRPMPGVWIFRTVGRALDHLRYHMPAWRTLTGCIALCWAAWMVDMWVLLALETLVCTMICIWMNYGRAEDYELALLKTGPWPREELYGEHLRAWGVVEKRHIQEILRCDTERSRWEARQDLRERMLRLGDGQMECMLQAVNLEKDTIQVAPVRRAARL